MSDFIKWRPHPWHGLSIGKGAPELVNAFIEITPFDLVKYEVDKSTGYTIIDRPQRTSSQPPALYGFVATLLKLIRERQPSHLAVVFDPPGGSFRNPGTIGEGLLERYGTVALVQELNANWIAGLNDYPTARHWEAYGAQLCEVFFEYFDSP